MRLIKHPIHTPRTDVALRGNTVSRAAQSPVTRTARLFWKKYFSLAAPAQQITCKGQTVLLGYFPVNQYRLQKLLALRYPPVVANAYMSGTRAIWGPHQIERQKNLFADFLDGILKEHSDTVRFTVKIDGTFDPLQTADLAGLVIVLAIHAPQARLKLSWKRSFNRAFRDFNSEHKLATFDARPVVKRLLPEWARGESKVEHR